MFRVPVALAVWIALSGAATSAAADQGFAPVRSDVTTVLGYYGLTSGISDRRFTTAWGNAHFANGFGTHAEAHFMDREESAGFFAGGVSWGGEPGEIRGWLGTSTENASILPELYARFEASYRTHSGTGLVFSPALTYRSFRNGAREAVAEMEVAKYISLGGPHLILSLMARGIASDPGRHMSASFGAGILYAQSGKVSVGLTLEGGRASYDGFLAPGTLDERYFSIRPVVSFHVTDNVEVLGLMEYSSRESYDAFGGHLGLKVHFGSN